MKFIRFDDSKWAFNHAEFPKWIFWYEVVVFLPYVSSIRKDFPESDHIRFVTHGMSLMPFNHASLRLQKMYQSLSKLYQRVMFNAHAKNGKPSDYDYNQWPVQSKKWCPFCPHLFTTRSNVSLKFSYSK